MTDEQKPTPTIEQQEALILDVARALDLARAKVLDLERRLVVARQATAKAHMEFLADHPLQTPSQAAHAFAAASQADRAAEAEAQAAYEARRVAAGVPRSFPIDHVGARDNSAEGQARRHMQTGHRKGAFSSNMKGRRVTHDALGRPLPSLEPQQ